MANDTAVALFAALLMAVGIIISAAAASTHGAGPATLYTNVLIGFGLSIILIFSLVALIANGRSKTATAMS